MACLSATTGRPGFASALWCASTCRHCRRTPSSSARRWKSTSTIASNVTASTTYRVTQAWEEATATWETMGESFGEAYGRSVFDPRQGRHWEGFDITDLVRGWMGGSPNDGVMLRGSEEPVTQDPLRYDFWGIEAREGGQFPPSARHSLATAVVPPLAVASCFASFLASIFCCTSTWTFFSMTEVAASVAAVSSRRR
ncbi:MAG: DNRLRE domain-containing protein [Anaerolineae bacterium]|nr:DNRLRE domain-containing protein [Anaerolineae bacterium]